MHHPRRRRMPRAVLPGRRRSGARRMLVGDGRASDGPRPGLVLPWTALVHQPDRRTDQPAGGCLADRVAGDRQGPPSLRRRRSSAVRPGHATGFLPAHAPRHVLLGARLPRGVGAAGVGGRVRALRGVLPCLRLCSRPGRLAAFRPRLPRAPHARVPAEHPVRGLPGACSTATLAGPTRCAMWA